MPKKATGPKRNSRAAKSKAKKPKAKMVAVAGAGADLSKRKSLRNA